VLVTVPVLTLLGHTDEPAELDGYGPIDADTARRLAAHAPSFQRILTHPETGALSSPTVAPPTGSPPTSPATSARATAPAGSPAAADGHGCDIDHTTDWARDVTPGTTISPTSAASTTAQARNPLADVPRGAGRHPLDLTRRSRTHDPPENPFVVPTHAALTEPVDSSQAEVA
jgi:hypothetical protein